jgi:hypothetical protein
MARKGRIYEAQRLAAVIIPGIIIAINAYALYVVTYAIGGMFTMNFELN